MKGHWDANVAAVLSLLMLVLCVGRLCWAARKKGHAFLQVVVSLLRGGRDTRQDAQNAEVLEELDKLLVQRRLQCARKMAFIAWVSSSFLGLQMILHVLSANGIMTLEGSELPRTMITLVLAVPAFFPQVLSREWHTLLLHWIVMLLLCVLALLNSQWEFAAFTSAQLSSAATAFCVLYPGVRVNAATNLLLTCCLIVSNATYKRDGMDSSALQQVITADMVLLAIRLGLCLAGNAILRLMTRQEVEASFGKCQQSAVSNLLDMMCDAVVDMDEHLALKEHFPKLAGMLMHGPGKSLKGELLSSLIPDDEDRARYHSNVREESASSRPIANGEAQLTPSMISVRLRDSIGNLIEVMLFQVPYLSIGGRIHHLVGLREDHDAKTPGARPALQQPALQPQAKLRTSIADMLVHVGDDESLPSEPPSHNRSRSRKGTGNSHRSAHGRDSNGMNEAAADPSRPHRCRSADVILSDRLPFFWASQEVRDDLGVDGPLDPDSLPELGDYLSDGGESLLATVQVRRCLGEWNLKSSGKNSNEPSASFARTLWLTCLLPLPENAGRPYATLAFTGRERQEDGLAGASAAVGGRPPTTTSL